VCLVLLTSVGLSVGFDEIKRAGISAQLTKPVRSSDLYECLVTAVTTGLPFSDSGMLDQAPGLKPNTPLGAYILLAEDNEVNQEVGVNMLQELGCRVDVAAYGLQAIEMLAQQNYDLVLMDCHMPQMDGFEATRLIRMREQIEYPQGELESTNLSHIPIIALTANALQGDREVCLAVGMDDFLSKPFSLEQLRGTLTRWLPVSPIADELRETDTLIERALLPSTHVKQFDPMPREKADLSTVIEGDALDNIRALQRPGRPDLVGTVINKYLSSAPIMLQNLAQGVAQGDARAVQQAAHSLKSSSANVGAARLAGYCQELERLSRANQVDPAEGQLRELEAEYEAVRVALITELQESSR
jgi:CheY-like chemotaxis protein